MRGELLKVGDIITVRDLEEIYSFKNRGGIILAITPFINLYKAHTTLIRGGTGETVPGEWWLDWLKLYDL